MTTNIAKSIQERLIDRKETLVTAESCTGGMIGARLTAESGSSGYFRGGAIVYTNEMKTLLLGVPTSTLDHVGAVSEEVAVSMAAGARAHLGSDWAVAVTGIAGPKADGTEKPVGLVYIAVAGPGDAVTVEKNLFDGDRDAVRRKTVERALELLWERIQ